MPEGIYKVSLGLVGEHTNRLLHLGRDGCTSIFVDGKRGVVEAYFRDGRWRTYFNIQVLDVWLGQDPRDMIAAAILGVSNYGHEISVEDAAHAMLALTMPEPLHYAVDHIASGKYETEEQLMAYYDEAEGWHRRIKGSYIPQLETAHPILEKARIYR